MRCVLPLRVLASLFYRVVDNCRLFMEKQIMGELVRVLRTSRTLGVSFQLLQSMSILIQNLRKEHAICKLSVKEANLILKILKRFDGHFHNNLFADYLLSNEHMNHLISYSFDFRNQDILNYYISFLRFVVIYFNCLFW